MESTGRQASSDTNSSEENERQEQVNKDDSAGTTTTTKRSYECTFCKRGFTNAQALGGHMNIHRKDRAKAKQQPTAGPGTSISSKHINEDFVSARYIAPISSDASTYYQIMEEQRSYHHHHQMYFEPSLVSSNPRSCPFGYHETDFFLTKSQSVSMNDEPFGANLSLRIGSNHRAEGNEIKRVTVKEDEVDLELRLGHDP